MQLTSAAFSHSTFPIPNHFTTFSPIQILHLRLHVKPTKLLLPKRQIYTKNLCSLTLPTANHCRQDKGNQYPDRKTTFFDQFQSSKDKNNISDQDPEPRNQEKGSGNHPGGRNFWSVLRRIFTNMRWAEVKAALGQRINIEGIVSSVAVFVKDRHLALPHVSVPDVRYIDWNELHRRGFKGVVFDKDNTITLPYSLTLWAPLGPSLELCKSVFGNDIAVFSNSAGLLEYDHNGSKARALEKAVGIKVIRHRVKKPAGSAEEIEKHFGCKSSQLIMVGDRPFTDIVYGNRNGFLTVLTEPLSLSGEPFIVKQVRKLELALVNRWLRKGLKPSSHDLLPDPQHSVKDPHP